jgi:hypothetical protein
MQVQRTSSQIIITLPAQVNVEGLQRLLDYLEYSESELTNQSQATQEDIDALASEVNKNWWEKNKNHYTNANL